MHGAHPFALFYTHTRRAELDWTVRSGAFRHWTTLRGLRCLSLRCNFYLKDADWQALLEGLPHLQVGRGGGCVVGPRTVGGACCCSWAPAAGACGWMGLLCPMAC